MTFGKKFTGWHAVAFATIAFVGVGWIARGEISNHLNDFDKTRVELANTKMQLAADIRSNQNAINMIAIANMRSRLTQLRYENGGPGCPKGSKTTQQECSLLFQRIAIEMQKFIKK